MSSAATLPPIGPPPPSARRFTVDEYHRMLASGVFKDGDPFELLGGWIVPKISRNPPHDLTLGLIDDMLKPFLPAMWVVRLPCAITTGDSEPEPDLAVVLGLRRRYTTAHPTPADIGLLIEVAETTLADDRGRKLQIYARALIPAYWIVNLVDRQIEAYSDPIAIGAGAIYRTCKVYCSSDNVLVILDGQIVGQFAVSAVLP